MIDETYAWHLLRDAATRDRNSAMDQPLSPEDRFGVRFGPAGWRSDEPVDGPARSLLDVLLPVATGGARFVIAQLGQSLDGRIATVTGASHYVTGEASRIHLHRLRALVDAVVVGAGTVTADDPKLTVRHVEGRNPVRVVLDPNARVPSERRVFSDGAAPTLHLVAGGSARAHRGAGVETRPVAVGADGVQPDQVLADLAARGLRRVLIEGGGNTVSRFLAADRLDRLHIAVAPMLIGSGHAALTLPEIATLDAARRPRCRTHRLGNDMLFDLDLLAALA